MRAELLQQRAGLLPSQNKLVGGWQGGGDE
jgi:hypothetical protein